MKLSKISCTALLFTSIAYGSAHATVQDNIFCIENADFTEYNEISHSISADQIYNSVGIVKQRSGKRCLNIVAGNHKSTAVAEWVKQNMNLLGVKWDTDNMQGGLDSTPEDLNFASYGTMGILLNNQHYTCPNIQIGLSSSNLSEGWWIFSNTNTLEDKLACTDDHNNPTPIYMTSWFDFIRLSTTPFII